MTASSPFDELLALAARGCDDRLTQQDVEHLEQLLRDPDAQRCYLQFVELDMGLSWLGNNATTPLQLPALRRRPVVASMGRIVKYLSQSPIAATLVVASVVYGGFGFIVWQMSRYVVEQEIGEAATAARLIAADDCQWSGTPSAPKVGAALPTGEINLASGTAEFVFAGGARVTLEGPARFCLEHGDRARLDRGKLFASVPREAVGFTVTTPTATIVDLGTEFGVEVGESGTTDIQVTKGTVELYPGRQSSLASAPTPIKLSAGAARRVEASIVGETTVREIAHQPQRFAQQGKPTAVARLSVRGAMASSEFMSNRQANNLINGSGMQGNRHVNYANGAMWMTEPGHVKQEFVLFDLGRACRLDSMKVWNYNEIRGGEGSGLLGNLFEERGLALADIYVSDTGKWDPFKRPDDWRLIITDQRFTVADGTENYSTPDVIQLKGVKARFVAIVTKARHNADRTPSIDNGAEYVGLSEVQFFGERLEPASVRAQKP